MDVIHEHKTSKIETITDEPDTRGRVRRVRRVSAIGMQLLRDVFSDASVLDLHLDSCLELVNCADDEVETSRYRD